MNSACVCLIIRASFPPLARFSSQKKKVKRRIYVFQGRKAQKKQEGICFSRSLLEDESRKEEGSESKKQHHIIIRNINVFHREEKWCEITIFIDRACFDSKQKPFSVLFGLGVEIIPREELFSSKEPKHSNLCCSLFPGAMYVLHKTVSTRYTNDMEMFLVLLSPTDALMIDAFPHRNRVGFGGEKIIEKIDSSLSNLAFISHRLLQITRSIFNL